MATLRWVLTDPVTSETWTMPINPDSASPVPLKTRQMRHAAGAGGGRVRTFVTPPDPRNWEFGGVIRTQEHYDALLAWAQKPNQILIDDHLGRRFTVVIQGWEPEDRKPTPNTPWRLRYVMKTVMVDRGLTP